MYLVWKWEHAYEDQIHMHNLANLNIHEASHKPFVSRNFFEFFLGGCACYRHRVPFRSVYWVQVHDECAVGCIDVQESEYIFSQVCCALYTSLKKKAVVKHLW